MHYDRACQGGDADGCAMVGILYFKGEGGPRDAARARHYLDLACDSGSGGGCREAGVFAYQGIGGKQDVAMARKRFEKGCELGHGGACAAAGDYVARAEDGPRSATAALPLYQSACRLGHGDGCLQLGALLLRGGEVPADGEAALTAFTGACERGLIPGCAYGGWLALATGRDGDAEKMLAQACREDGKTLSLMACFNLGYLRALHKDDLDGGEATLAKACSDGYPIACLAVATMRRLVAPADATALAQPNIASVHDLCQQEQEAESCLVLADWYGANGQSSEAAPLREVGLRFAGKDCKTGDTIGCFLAKGRRPFVPRPLPPVADPAAVAPTP